MTAAVAPSTGRGPGTLRADLEPVREALLRDAEGEAEQTVSVATASADAVVAAATAEVDAEIERAGHRAALAAQARSQQALARLRNDCHRDVLAARERLRHQLIDQVHAAARDLRGDPRYPALLDHLEALARRQLGGEAVIERDLQPDGGLTAEAGSRRVDYRLDALADRALDALADDVADLWK